MSGKFPNVFIAILVKQKEEVLPLFLETLENLDYPKENIFLYVRTNNNTDNTEKILRNWLSSNGQYYQDYLFDCSNVAAKIENYGVHHWNAERFKVLGKIRQESLRQALLTDCEYYFVVDIDNFIYPDTLKELIALDLPIVAPLLRYAVANSDYPDTDEQKEEYGTHQNRYYSNFHYVVDDYGSVLPEPIYYELLYQRRRGTHKVDCVHCTYLIKREHLSSLTYLDDTERWEYMIFSHHARNKGITQYLDNRKIYGVLTLTENAKISRWMYDYLLDPETREERYNKLNIPDV